MTTKFNREERHIVFKLSDVERYLTAADRSHLEMMKMEVDAGRDCANKPPFKGLIVEADWPEYEPTWKAIEARVTGAQPAPTIAEQDQINAEAAIRSIYGARPKDEALWQIIVSGMITPAHVAQAGAERAGWVEARADCQHRRNG